MVSVGVAAAATVAIYYLSARVTADKDRELKKYQAESQIQIADAETGAAKAMKIAESERLARAKLESQIAGAEERAAEANAVASKAQLELARIKEPRTIAPEDQEKVIAALKKFAGQNFGFAVFRDPESFSLLRTLDAMLKSAGWLRVPHQVGVIFVNIAGDTATATNEAGVTAFIGPDNPDAAEALRALSRVLTIAGIPCRMSPTEHLRDKTPKAILINIGKKP